MVHGRGGGEYVPYLNQFIQPDTILPDPRIPADWNKYTYTRDNPINYTDPSGHCRSDDTNCWTLLHRIESDNPFIDLQTDISSNKGQWSVSELLTLDNDLRRLKQATKISMSEVFSPKEIRIARVSQLMYGGKLACGGYHGHTILMKLDQPMNITDEYFNNRTGCDGTIENEIGKWWNYKDNLSDTFAKYVGATSIEIFWITIHYDPGPESPPASLGWGPRNVREDFGGSFSEYVRLETHESIGPTNIIVGQKRWKFMESLLDTGIAPVNSSGTASSCLDFSFR